jgi:hypothetical protein
MKVLLSEKLAKVTDEHTPGAKLCFNAKPDDTGEPPNLESESSGAPCWS